MELKSMEEKLQILTQQIRTAIPRLMKVSEGCYIQQKGMFKNFKIIHGRERDFLIDDYKHHKPISCTKKDINDYYEIIGHEPMLNDVLEWLNTPEMLNVISDKIKYTGYDGFVVLNRDGYLNISYYEYEYNISLNSRLGKWNLSKAYLKDQSNELIDFLYKLIK